MSDYPFKNDYTEAVLLGPNGQPFCGVMDTPRPGFAEVVASWRKKRIIWSVKGSLPGVSANAFRAAILEAVTNWSNVCGLTFGEAASGQVADIVINASNIDGPSSVLAWSELPDGSDRPLSQMYDTSEKFVIAQNPNQGYIDLVAVACHELGHALGLDHAGQNTSDLMAPYYRAGLRTPQAGDIARIQRLYGPNTGPPVPNPVPPTNPPSGPVNPIVIKIYGAELIEIPGYRVSKL